MNSPADFATAFEHARGLQAQGRLIEAEQAYRSLAAPGEKREAVLRALVELYMRSGRLQETIDTLVALTYEVPDSLYYYARLAGLLEGVGQIDAAIGHYRRLLGRRPEYADAHYNLALLYKKNKQYADALDCYESAIRHGITDVEVVYSNMGVLHSEMRHAEKAKEMYEKALQARPGHLPALFNLAGLMEEAGERDAAIQLYQRILSIEPRHWESLARLANARKITGEDTSTVDSLRRAVADTADDPKSREGLLFALGKSLDDQGRFDQAFAAYRAANELGRSHGPRYDRTAVELAFDRQMDLMSAAWISKSATDSTEQPIFICGMFRSGSTLVEQVLAAHPEVTAGGEMDNLPWLIDRRLQPYPDRAINASHAELQETGSLYLDTIRTLFPEARRITDKRPDNFLHIGLIKALFPAAKVIYTRRNAADNCLSLFFHQLDPRVAYATDLDDAAHYYLQHSRLMAHWAKCLGSDMFTVDYDAFVRSPEPVIRALLDYLGLEWDARCLEFQQAGNLVKTASVWQVREGFYRHSSGRWKNYLPFLGKDSLFTRMAGDPR